MNIKQAKEQIKNAMTAYFTKDQFGNYKIPIEKQRPIFLMGPPGIGKTAIMEQIAAEREDIKVGKINVDEEVELARAFGISSIPAVFVVKDGKVCGQSLGLTTKEKLLALL